MIERVIKQQITESFVDTKTVKRPLVYTDIHLPYIFSYG